MYKYIPYEPFEVETLNTGVNTLALREYETYFRRCIQGNRVYRRGGVIPGRPVRRHPLVPTAAFGVALLVALVTYFL